MERKYFSAKWHFLLSVFASFLPLTWIHLALTDFPKGDSRASSSQHSD